MVFEFLPGSKRHIYENVDEIMQMDVEDIKKINPKDIGFYLQWDIIEKNDEWRKENKNKIDALNSVFSQKKEERKILPKIKNVFSGVFSSNPSHPNYIKDDIRRLQNAIRKIQSDIDGIREYMIQEKDTMEPKSYQDLMEEYNQLNENLKTKMVELKDLQSQSMDPKNPFKKMGGTKNKKSTTKRKSHKKSRKNRRI